MSKLRYVGASPNLSNSVLPYRSVTSKISGATSNQIDHIQRAKDLSSNYLTQSDIDNELGKYLKSSELSSTASLYLDSNAPGKTVVSLSNGKIPTSQLPSYVTGGGEPSGVQVQTTIPRSTYSNLTPSTIRTFTVSDPGYQWYPMIFGVAEATADSTTSVALQVVDSRGDILAESKAKVSGLGQVAIQSSTNATVQYTGSMTFRVQGYVNGSGRGSTTGVNSHLVVIPVPA